MAVPAIASIQDASRMIAERIGATRLHLADMIDAARLAGDSHLERVYAAMLREAA